MRNKYLTILVLSLLLIANVIATFIIGYDAGVRHSKPINTSDTVTVSDTVIKIDSCKKEKPNLVYIKIIKRDTIINNVGDTIELVKENKAYRDTIICAKDTVEVMNYISGYDASLDSLKVRLSRQEITSTVEITKYITQPKTFKDHFSIGLGVGYGYGMNNKQFEPFIGVTASYNFGF